MRRIRNRLPHPALVISVIALIAALAGTSYAAIGLGGLSKSAKNKTVGVGALTYVTGPSVQGPTGGGNLKVATASCPPGLRPIGGGIAVDIFGAVVDSYPVTNGWGGEVSLGPGGTAQAFVACAKSRRVTGADVLRPSVVPG